MNLKLFGNASIFLGANIVLAGIPFLLLPLLTNVLSPDEYGVVAMFGIMVNVFGTLTGLSVHGAVGVRSYELEREELSRYIGGCVVILVISTLVVVGLVYLLADWLSIVTNLPLDWLIAAVFASGMQFLINIRLTLLQVRGRATPYGLFQVGQALIGGGLTLLFVLLLFKSWEGRTLAQLLTTSGFGIAALVWLVLKKEVSLPRLADNHVINAIKFGVPLIPHVVGGMVMVVADRFVVGKILGLHAVGIYTLALQFGMVLGLAADAFNKVYGPWLYSKLKNNTVDDRLLIVGVTYLSWIMFLLVVLAAQLLCKFFFFDVVGENFGDAQELVFWFFIGQLFKFMYLSISGFYFFYSRTGKLSVVTAATGGFSILCTGVLVLLFGLKGGAIAYAISEATLFIVALISSLKIKKMPWLSVSKAFVFAIEKART